MAILTATFRSLICKANLSFTVLLLIHWTIFFPFVQPIKSRNGCAIIIIKPISYLGKIMKFEQIRGRETIQQLFASDFSQK